MTLEELLAVAEIVEKLTNRYRDQEAAHKAALTEIRASFNARTSADEKLIEGYRRQIVSLGAANDRLNDLLRVERLAHRAEVAALQERLRASIARGDFAQMEVAALKSQTPKHPVKVGEWVRRTSFEHSIGTRIGAIAQVIDMDDDGDYEVAINGTKHCWSPKYCTPCDPPEATPVMPKPGDMVRLVSRPERDNVDKNLRTALWWPWEDRWGVVGQTRKVVAGCRYIPGAVAVATDSYAHWPLSCVEVVAEATHDTEAGKAAAEAAVKTEPVADEIKVGDVVEVVSNTGRNTWLADVGSVGTVVTVEEINDSISVHLENIPGKKNALAGYVSFCDVRKVTT